MALQELEYACQRLRAFRQEVDQLLESDFPYDDSQNVLQNVRDIFDAKLRRLEQLSGSNDTAAVRQECSRTLQALFIFVQLLGFIVRSTTVRNAFELRGPLRRLVRAVLEPKASSTTQTTSLVLSSEWSFSPFTYRPIPELPGVVFIGLPATESANPLLIPLAGHELGHSVWVKYKLEARYKSEVKQNVVTAIKNIWSQYVDMHPELKGVKAEELTNNLYAVASFQLAVSWGTRQAEETFCDFIGIRLFGTAFLHAFAYLLAPKTGGSRPSYYPNMLTRIQNQQKAATQFEIAVPPNYAAMFENIPEPTLGTRDEIQSKLADESLPGLVPGLIEQADKLIKDSGASLPSSEETQRIVKRFEYVVPAERCKSLQDIIEAAWIAAIDPEFWKKHPQMKERKLEGIKELALKNLEVLDYEQILEANA